MSLFQRVFLSGDRVLKIATMYDLFGKVFLIVFELCYEDGLGFMGALESFF